VRRRGYIDAEPEGEPCQVGKDARRAQLMLDLMAQRFVGFLNPADPAVVAEVRWTHKYLTGLIRSALMYEAMKEHLKQAKNQ
jgi:hypothetical protein